MAGVSLGIRKEPGVVAASVWLLLIPVYCRYWLSSFADTMGAIVVPRLHYLFQVFFFFISCDSTASPVSVTVIIFTRA